MSALAVNATAVEKAVIVGLMVLMPAGWVYGNKTASQRSKACLRVKLHNCLKCYLVTVCDVSLLADSIVCGEHRRLIDSPWIVRYPNTSGAT